MRLPSVERELLTQAISRNLDVVFERRSRCTFGLYWPIKGEFDLRPWAARLCVRKRYTLALPVVVKERTPLEYWQWQPAIQWSGAFGASWCRNGANPSCQM
jgi:5-formyltetrahydrofolate cyclo-ligase